MIRMLIWLACPSACIMLCSHSGLGLLQVVHLEEDDREGEDAAAFYSALGVADPGSASIKAAA